MNILYQQHVAYCTNRHTVYGFNFVVFFFPSSFKWQEIFRVLDFMNCEHELLVLMQNVKLSWDLISNLLLLQNLPNQIPANILTNCYLGEIQSIYSMGIYSCEYVYATISKYMYICMTDIFVKYKVKICNVQAIL